VSLVSILGTLAVSAERMANLVSVPDKFHEALPWTTYFDYDWVPAGRFGFVSALLVILRTQTRRFMCKFPTIGATYKTKGLFTLAQHEMR
jgi:hypothetical protein